MCVSRSLYAFCMSLIRKFLKKRTSIFHTLLAGVPSDLDIDSLELKSELEVETDGEDGDSAREEL